MNKIIIRLVAVGMALALSVTLVLMTTYAWLTLSTSPAVSGIQMSIGDNTLLVAADMTETSNGVTYHYPGEFSDTLNFSQHQSYQYLRSLGGMRPVSTADGINWFMPPGEEDSQDDLIQVTLSDGVAASFKLDNTLANANMTADQVEDNSEGHYVYLDFWVVAPAGNYTLRVSTGEDSSGSFLIDLPEAAKNDDGSYVLQDPDGGVSAIARVGFLVNDQKIEDDTMLHYVNSAQYNNRYKALRGNYSEAGTRASDNSYRFTIYEPNGDYHPGSTALNGAYVATMPIGLTENADAAPAAVNMLTAVQKYSSWMLSADGLERRINQSFQAFMINKDFSGSDEETVTSAFYDSLQGQISSYINKGEFIRKSTELGDYVSAEILDALDGDDYNGASEDVYIIKLERNIPQRIRMFIWLEGQDMDCTNNTGVSSFALNIELAGGSE